MDYRIEQADDGTWRIFRAGTVLHEGLTHEAALATISDDMLSEVAAAAAAGLGPDDAETALLPEAWEIPVLSETAATGPYRTFEQVTWSALDPGAHFVPLWLSTTQEGGGHMGARLAGFFTRLDVGPTPSGAGRFFNSDAGREFRDILTGAERYGISADPTENVEYEFECLEMSDDGMYCTSERVSFTAYQIGGATGTASPGFPNAYIVLAAPEDDAAPTAASSVVAAAETVVQNAHHAAIAAGRARTGGSACCDACASRDTAGRRPGMASVSYLRDRRALIASSPVAIPLEPPRDWFGDPHFDAPAPLTITSEGRFFGHLATWDECHTGSPLGECLIAPRSSTNYGYFLTGYIVCDDGSEVAVGRYTLVGGHPDDDQMTARAALAHYDDSRSGIAEVAVGEDAHGIWMAGALCPGVTPEQIRLARATAPSGDWRPIGAGRELVAALAVNSQGFVTARVASGRVVALTACSARLARLNAEQAGEGQRVARLERQVADLRAEAQGPARATLAAAANQRARSLLRR